MSQLHASACRLACLASAFGLAAALSTGAFASDNKIALIPGGPHPYFAPWEQAAKDAQKDFGIAAVDFKVPQKWKLNLQTELRREPCRAGLQGLRHLPRRRGRHQLDRLRAEIGGHPLGGARRLRPGPDRRRLLPRHRRLQLRLSRHQAPDQGDGRQGQHRAPRRAAGRPQHHAPGRGGRDGGRPRPTAPSSFSRPSPIPTRRKRPTRRSTRSSPGRRTRSTA